MLQQKKNIEEKHKGRKFGMEVDVKKDLFQMGGSFLIDQKGKVLLEHIDSYYGDHAKEADIIEAIQNYYGEEK